MLQFHPYGLLISLGILAGLAVAWWRKKLYGITENDLENLFILTVPFGLIGARIYHVLDKWNYYGENPMQIISVWNGGLGIYGGVIGGLIGLWIFTKIQKSKFKNQNLLDFLMPSLAIGQAIGRWGNFFNHEVYGPPTNLPWGWFIPQNLRPEIWKNYSFFQPTFAYESIWVIIGFFILIILELSLRGVKRRSNLLPSGYEIATPRTVRYMARNDKTGAATTQKGSNYGLLTGFYAVWYGVGRFFLEFLRFDTAEIWGIKTAQIISLGLIFFGIWQMRKAITT